MDYEKLLTDNLTLLEQVVRGVAHRHRLRDDEAEDVFGAIQLRLVQDDYRILRQFAGRSSLATYLTIVVTRHVLDERNARWGKWRPSIYAKRLGPVAVLLEKLLTRDEFKFSEAIELLRTNHQIAETEQELYRISLGFPPRSPRRFIDVGALEMVADDAEWEDRVERERRGELAAKIGSALEAAVASLDIQDQLLLKMYFREGLPLSRIAEVLKVESKPFYRRKDHAIALLGRELARQGISAEDVADITGEDLPPVIGADDVAGKPRQVRP